MRTTQSDKYISALNKLLRGEISAVEAYELAIKQIGGDPDGVLRENLDSHADRVSMLRDLVLESGGEPDETSGAWGSFTKLVEQSASIVGKKAIYAALEEGEDHGMREYRDRDKVEESVCEVIANDLLPAQQLTHDRMSALKNNYV